MKIELNKVAGYRTMLGIKQKDMALKLGISSQSYSNKENGKTPFNDLEKLKLRKIFKKIDNNISIDEIFFLSKKLLLVTFEKMEGEKWKK